MESQPDRDFGLLVAGTLFIGILLLYVFRSREKYKLPPGPRPWPVVGNLVHLGPLLHHELAKMAVKYGDLIHLRLGSRHVIACSSPQRAEEIFKTHDRIFAARPQNAFNKNFMHDSQGIVSSPYGPYWRHVRKIISTELFTTKRLQHFQNLREESVLKALTSLINACKDGKPTRMDEQLHELMLQNITGITLGETHHGSERDSAASALTSRGAYQFKHLIEKASALGTSFVPGDFFPLLRPFDLLGNEKRMKEAAEESEGILERVFCEHEERNRSLKTSDAAVDEGTQDFVDVLLAKSEPGNEEPLTRYQVKAILQDVLIAGIDTASLHLGWIFTELLRNPSTLRRAQEELDTVIGRDRLVKESDVSRLPYLQAIVKETFRLRPNLPLLVPHASSEACVLEGGYYIPKDCMVFVNVWAIGRDPTLWENPLEFNPDRFLAEDKDYSGQLFDFLPFGSGRRICPAKVFAGMLVEYSLAAMLHACDWTLPPGMKPEDVDVRESPGFAIPRATPLLAVASPRLPSSVIFAAQQPA